ncbi:MAG: aminotransferase class I/II-fold pyridoxal phosphate-dependent enzyme [Polyangiaceae bacterium]
MFHVIPAHQSRPADDPIFALNREATDRKKKGEAILNATVGALLDDDGNLAVLPSAARAVKEVPEGEWAAYAPIAGNPDFLQAVVADLFGSDDTLRACAIASATPGGSGALRHAISNYLEPGQAVLTTSHFWGPYQTLADEADRKVATFPMFAADGGLDVDALDREVGRLAKEQGRVLLFLNDPCHNPTGYSMTRDEWTRVTACLLRHAATTPVTLLVDCAYAAYGAGDPRAFTKDLHPLLGKVGLLFAWSASKTFTHYGLRVGALVACVPDAKDRAATDAALSYSARGTWSNCNRGGLRAVTRLLTDPALAASCAKERDGLKALLTARVNRWNALAKPAGLKYPRYDGGFFVTVFTPDAAAKAAAMRVDGVFVVPQRESIRVALCSVAERDVERLVQILAKHLGS